MNHSHIAVAIFAGFCVIGAAIYFKEMPTVVPTQAVVGQVAPGQPAAPRDYGNPTRGAEARVYGSASAPVRVIEFSDFECTFCARLHPTLKRIVDESAGQIAWEYRHLPLPNHPNAYPGAIASECVARELGIDAFWDYTEIIFANIGQQSPAFFLSEAGKLGLSAGGFNSCIEDESIIALVQSDMQAASSMGANGTPFNVVVRADGSGEGVSGAVPYDQWQQILNR